MPVLRPLGDGDLDMAFHLASQKGTEWLRVSREGVPNPTQMAVRLWAGVFAQWVVEMNRSPVGVAALYSVSERRVQVVTATPRG